MATKAKSEKPEDIETGAIIYSDGGSRADFGGYGIHGYTYSNLPPTKGSGNPTQYLTNIGYVPKIEAKNKAAITEVKPLRYINGYSSFTMPVTNNVAEIAGATTGLNFAIDKNLKSVSIITDSEMVVKGANGWLNTWKKNKWIKTDGSPVANKSWWEALDNNLSKLKDKGADVTFKWVKGHSTHMGNQVADKLATIGVLQSKEGNLRTELHIDKADGYWTSTVDKSPFITQKRIYFTTRPDTIVAGEYYLGDHGKDDDLLGKRTADGCYSYVKLKTPEPVIEIMRNKQSKLADGLDVIIMARLDKIYEPSVYKDAMAYGEICFYAPFRDKLDMNFVDNEPVSRELRPPRLAMRAIEAVNTLKGITLAHEFGTDPNLVSTDITNVLYDISDKGEYKLKPEYIVGFTSFEVEVNYFDKITPLKEKIELCMGVDLPDRNYLKRMEKMKPAVTVVTWMESDKMFRYATLIQTPEAIGMFAGWYSNMKFIK